MTLREHRQQDGSVGKKRARSSKGADVQPNYQYDFIADKGAGTCTMAASIYEMLQEAKCQRQAVGSWGQDSSADHVSKPAAAPSVLSSSACSSPSRTSSTDVWNSLPRASSYADDVHDPRSFRAVVGISAPRMPHPSSSSERGTETTAAIKRPDPMADSLGGQQSARSGRSNPHDALRREHLGGLNAELHNLRRHLLQRANGNYVP